MGLLCKWQRCSQYLYNSFPQETTSNLREVSGKKNASPQKEFTLKNIYLKDENPQLEQLSHLIASYYLTNPSISYWTTKISITKLAKIAFVRRCVVIVLANYFPERRGFCLKLLLIFRTLFIWVLNRQLWLRFGWFY